MIRCRELQWGHGGRPLTPPLNLQLAGGSLSAIIGGNGCGKSSLLEVIAGLRAPLAGRVELAVPSCGGVAYLVQQQRLDRQFPIKLEDLVGAGLWRSRLNRRQRQASLEQALEDWGLLELRQQCLQALSGGELQRALLARLSLTEAHLLLLDEPETALDEQGQALLWRHIRRWQRQGRTLLLVSHDIEALRRQLDQALLIAADGCRFVPLGSLLERRTLERVA